MSRSKSNLGLPERIPSRPKFGLRDLALHQVALRVKRDLLLHLHLLSYICAGSRVQVSAHNLNGHISAALFEGQPAVAIKGIIAYAGNSLRSL